MDRIYDEDGKQWGLHEDKRIFDPYTGKPILWIWGRHVFTWKGAHIGYFEDDWFYDHDGKAVGHIGAAEGGPGRASELIEVKNPDFFDDIPETFPRRQKGFPPEPDEKGAEWGVLNGRAYFTSFITPEGEAKDEARDAWLEVRDRVQANLSSVEAAAEAEAEAEPEPVAPPTQADPEALAALNEAIAAYRMEMAGGNIEALAMARVKLSAAAEQYAIKSGEALSA